MPPGQASGGEAGRARGTCQALKCRARGGVGRPVQRPTINLSDVVTHWALCVSSLCSVALCSLASKDGNVQPPNMPEARFFFSFLF